MNLNQVNTQQLRRLIRLCVETGKTLYIEGGPGCGKTAITRDVLSGMEREQIYECAAYLNQSNFGLPCPDGDWLRVLRPQRWFEKKATLIFDEADKLSPMLQQQMCQIAHEQRLGDDRMKPGSSVILIGNRVQDANGSYGSSNILTSRCARVSFEPTSDEIMAYAHKAKWHPALTAALDLNRSLCYKPNAGKDRFPSPRTWENCSTLMIASEDDQGLWPHIISAHVGDEAASHVVALLECYSELVPVADVYKNPSKAPIPKKPHARMLQAHVVAGSSTNDTLKAALTYLYRMPAEVWLSMFQAICTVYSSVCMGELIDWARQNGQMDAMKGLIIQPEGK